MRLCESEEGRLSRPGEPRRASQPAAGKEEDDGEAKLPSAAVDRPWLEAHLSSMVDQLQDALSAANPEPSLTALNGRLETIEQRFGAALGRVAQRADLDGLKSIEAHVLELAGELEQARGRLEQIGTVDDQLRVIARKLDEAGEQRALGLEKLLRECIAEWRDGEQRTTGALHSLEEAVRQLSDAVDAMEASKPAADLSIPQLTGTADAAGTIGAPLAASIPLERFYRSTLDAADYVPKLEDVRAPAAALLAQNQREDGMDWARASVDRDRSSAAKLTPGALRIKALRAKLRQPPRARYTVPSRYEKAAGTSAASPAQRASLSVLLMMGAAFVAGSTYLLYQTFVAALSAAPARIERGAHPAVGGSDLADPSGRRGAS